MTTLAALQLALALLPLVTTGLTQFIQFIDSLRLALQQSGEWTEAQEQDYRRALFAKLGDPAYAPDPGP
jgi:hypothetical protein